MEYKVLSAEAQPDGQIVLSVQVADDQGNTLAGGGTVGAGSDLDVMATHIAAGLAVQLATPPDPPAPAPAPIDVAAIKIDPAAVEVAKAALVEAAAAIAVESASVEAKTTP